MSVSRFWDKEGGKWDRWKDNLVLPCYSHFFCGAETLLRHLVDTVGTKISLLIFFFFFFNLQNNLGIEKKKKLIHGPDPKRWPYISDVPAIHGV